MKYYELICLIKPDLSEDELATLSQKICHLIEEERGEIKDRKNLSPNSLVKKRLGYPIKKERMAYLAVLGFASSPEKLTAIQNKLKAETQILRYMIMAKKEKPVIPKPTRKPEILPLASRKQASKVELKEIDKKLEEILGEE